MRRDKREGAIKLCIYYRLDSMFSRTSSSRFFALTTGESGGPVTRRGRGGERRGEEERESVLHHSTTQATHSITHRASLLLSLACDEEVLHFYDGRSPGEKLRFDMFGSEEGGRGRMNKPILV